MLYKIYFLLKHFAFLFVKVKMMTMLLNQMTKAFDEKTQLLDTLAQREREQEAALVPAQVSVPDRKQVIEESKRRYRSVPRLHFRCVEMFAHAQQTPLTFARDVSSINGNLRLTFSPPQAG